MFVIGQTPDALLVGSKNGVMSCGVPFPPPPSAAPIAMFDTTTPDTGDPSVGSIASNTI